MSFRIADDLLSIPIYLYSDQAAAESGVERGGSGFLYGHEIPGTTNFILWAITNRHVIEGGSWTIRVNVKSGGFECIDTSDEEWVYHPTADIAMRPIKLSKDYHKFSYITTKWLLTSDWESTLEIGPGDPCFSIGRFIGNDGKQRNTPTVRFGQIAQSDVEPITHQGRTQSSYLVEIRSLGGFSGSPVFVYLDNAYYRPWKENKSAPDGSVIGVGRFPTGPWLLGVSWCMIPTWEKVCDASGREVQSGQQVPANSGMMGVVPTRHIIEMFAEGGAADLVQQRIVTANRALPAPPPSRVTTDE